jgi:uncharacterized membrane protein
MDNNIEILKKRYDRIGWGSLFILFGILSIIPGNHAGEFYLGFGIILLLVNLVTRYFSKIEINWFWSFVGILSLFAGIVKLLNLNFELPIFETTLIITGIVIIYRSFFGKNKEN